VAEATVVAEAGWGSDKTDHAAYNPVTQCLPAWVLVPISACLLGSILEPSCSTPRKPLRIFL